MPSEMRVTPSSLKSCAFLKSNVAGLASKVNSSSWVRSKISFSPAKSNRKCVGESMEGVPPPM